MDTTWEPYAVSVQDELLTQPSFDFERWPSNPSYNYTLDRPSTQLPIPSPTLLNSTKVEMLGLDQDDPEEEEELAAVKEMMFKVAAMQPVDIDPATIRRPRRRNVRISEDPQSVAARHRRERISEKIRILQRLVPGGTKMDTASMLEEAIRYVKFLKRQVRILQPAAPAGEFPGGAYLFNGVNDHGAGGGVNIHDTSHVF